MKFPTIMLIFSAHVFVESIAARSSINYDEGANINKLGVEFIKILTKSSKSDENSIFSPLNIYTALALLHLGASGETKNELSAGLNLPSDENKLSAAHQNISALLQEIQSSTITKVNVANGIFLQNGLNVKDSYSQAMQTNYQSETKSVDFAKAASEATDVVNKWVADKTNNRIPKLFANDISKDTVVLLASALYFAGKWDKPFYDGVTKLEKFNTGEKEVQVQLMNDSEQVPYTNNKDSQFEALSLPYMNGIFAMLVVLPYPNQTIKSFVETLTPEKYQQIVPSLRETYVNYKIPRLKLSSSQDINEHLAKLGMKQMFEKANLANMIDNVDLKVSKVTHAAEMEMNEEGTVASAITAIQLQLMSLPYYPNPPIPFHVDRPFLWAIYHRRTGATLFTGVVQNPLAQNI